MYLAKVSNSLFLTLFRKTLSLKWYYYTIINPIHSTIYQKIAYDDSLLLSFFINRISPFFHCSKSLPFINISPISCYETICIICEHIIIRFLFFFSRRQCRIKPVNSVAEEEFSNLKSKFILYLSSVLLSAFLFMLFSLSKFYLSMSKKYILIFK